MPDPWVIPATTPIGTSHAIAEHGAAQKWLRVELAGGPGTKGQTRTMTLSVCPCEPDSERTFVS